MNVAVLGASVKSTKYSYMACERLLAQGHQVFPVHPVYDEILGKKVYAHVSDIKEPIDTVTMYLNAERSMVLKDDLLALKPRRVIFNPGSESPDLESALKAEGIEVQQACTLVLLSINQF